MKQRPSKEAYGQCRHCWTSLRLAHSGLDNAEDVVAHTAHRPYDDGSLRTFGMWIQSRGPPFYPKATTLPPGNLDPMGKCNCRR